MPDLIDEKGEYFSKKAGEKLDFVINWANRLGTDTISNSTWSVPSGVNSTSNSSSNNTTTIWISGGTAGNEYSILNTITSAAGRIMQQAIRLKIEPPGVDTTALTDVNFLKKAMGRMETEPDSSVDNDLYQTLINSASLEISRITGRSFKINDFIDRIPRGGCANFLLAERPIVYVKSIHDNIQDALKITNGAANAISAQSWVSHDRKLNLLVVGGASNGLQSIDLTVSASDTLSELVTAVNALSASGWAASLATGRTGYELCEDLVEMTPAKIPSGGASIQMLCDPVAVPYHADWEAGILYLDYAVTKPAGSNTGAWLWVKYRGGYSAIPEDLQLICARYALALLSEIRSDPNMQSEWIGDYRYFRSSTPSAAITALEGQLASWKRDFV